ncbi:MAG: 30S ribosomal protein S6 [Acidimicrobiia bacterium]
MRPYEVMVILDADLDEETIRSSVGRYTQLIEGKGAQLGPIDFWGKRRFAYELKHRWEGYYVVLHAKAEPAAMDELHRVLSLADEVLRHKILRIPEAVYGKLGGPGARPAPVVSEAPPSSSGQASEPTEEAGAEPEADAEVIAEVVVEEAEVDAADASAS